MKQKIHWLEAGCIAALILTIATPAYANIGSNLVVAGMSHLIYLNFIIALVEAIAAVLLLRSAMFRLRWLKQLEPVSNEYPSALGVRKAYLPLLLTNLISAFIGLCILAPLSQYDSSWIPLNTMLHILIGFIFVTWILTILIEWPFVNILIRYSKLTFAKPMVASLVLCVVINTISYIGLFSYYRSAGDTSLITQAKYNSTASFLQISPVMFTILTPNPAMYTG